MSAPFAREIAVYATGTYAGAAFIAHLHADAWLCDSLRGRLHKYKRTAMRFVAAPLAHMQMCGCALRLWLHAHVHGCALGLWALAHAHMRSCALRRGIARTYADARLRASPWSARTCADARLRDSSQNRLHICRCAVVRFALERPHMCRCTAIRFVAGSLVHMHTHGYALRRGIARTYAYTRLRAPSRGACMTDGAHIKTRHFDRLGLVHAARKLALKSLSAQFVTGLTAPAGMRTTHGGMIRIPHRMIDTPCCASAKYRRARMTASAVCSAPPGAAIQVR